MMYLVSRKRKIFRLVAIATASVFISSSLAPGAAWAGRSAAGGGDIAEFSWGDFALSMGLSIAPAIIGPALTSGYDALAGGTQAAGATQSGLQAYSALNEAQAVSSSVSNALSISNMVSNAVDSFTIASTTSEVARAVGKVGGYYEWDPRVTLVVSQAASGATGGYLNPQAALGNAMLKTMSPIDLTTMGNGALVGAVGGLTNGLIMVAVDSDRIKEGKGPGTTAQIAGMVGETFATTWARELLNPITYDAVQVQHEFKSQAVVNPETKQIELKQTWQETGRGPSQLTLQELNEKTGVLEIDQTLTQRQITSDKPLVVLDQSYPRISAQDFSKNKPLIAEVLAGKKEIRAEVFDKTTGLPTQLAIIDPQNYKPAVGFRATLGIFNSADYLGQRNGQHLFLQGGPNPQVFRLDAGKGGPAWFLERSRIAPDGTAWLPTRSPAPELISQRTSLSTGFYKTLDQWPQMTATAAGIAVSNAMGDSKWRPLASTVTSALTGPLLDRAAMAYGWKPSISKDLELKLGHYPELKYQYAQIRIEAERRKVAEETFEHLEPVVIPSMLPYKNRITELEKQIGQLDTKIEQGTQDIAGLLEAKQEELEKLRQLEKPAPAPSIDTLRQGPTLAPPSLSDFARSFDDGLTPRPAPEPETDFALAEIKKELEGPMPETPGLKPSLPEPALRIDPQELKSLREGPRLPAPEPSKFLVPGLDAPLFAETIPTVGTYDPFIVEWADAEIAELDALKAQRQSLVAQRDRFKQEISAGRIPTSVPWTLPEGLVNDLGLKNLQGKVWEAEKNNLSTQIEEKKALLAQLPKESKQYQDLSTTIENMDKELKALENPNYFLDNINAARQKAWAQRLLNNQSYTLKDDIKIVGPSLKGLVSQRQALGQREFFKEHSGVFVPDIAEIKLRPWQVFKYGASDVLKTELLPALASGGMQVALNQLIDDDDPAKAALVSFAGTMAASAIRGAQMYMKAHKWYNEQLQSINDLAFGQTFVPSPSAYNTLKDETSIILARIRGDLPLPDPTRYSIKEREFLGAGGEIFSKEKLVGPALSKVEEKINALDQQIQSAKLTIKDNAQGLPVVSQYSEEGQQHLQETLQGLTYDLAKLQAQKQELSRISEKINDLGVKNLAEVQKEIGAILAKEDFQKAYPELSAALSPMQSLREELIKPLPFPSSRYIFAPQNDIKITDSGINMIYAYYTDVQGKIIPPGTKVDDPASLVRHVLEPGDPGYANVKLIKGWGVEGNVISPKDRYLLNGQEVGAYHLIKPPSLSDALRGNIAQGLFEFGCRTLSMGLPFTAGRILKPIDWTNYRRTLHSIASTAAAAKIGDPKQGNQRENNLWSTMLDQASNIGIDMMTNRLLPLVDALPLMDLNYAQVIPVTGYKGLRYNEVVVKDAAWKEGMQIFYPYWPYQILDPVSNDPFWATFNAQLKGLIEITTTEESTQQPKDLERPKY